MNAADPGDEIDCCVPNVGERAAAEIFVAVRINELDGTTPGTGAAAACIDLPPADVCLAGLGVGAGSNSAFCRITKGLCADAVRRRPRGAVRAPRG